jgi:hypothetical protein
MHNACKIWKLASFGLGKAPEGRGVIAKNPKGFQIVFPRVDALDVAGQHVSLALEDPI